MCRAYVNAVCESVWCDYLRQVHRQVPTIALDCYEDLAEEEGYAQAEARLIVEQALAQLSQRERFIVEQRYLQEEPFSQIAEVLGEPVERVKKACQRAIAKLQRWAQEGTGG